MKLIEITDQSRVSGKDFKLLKAHYSNEFIVAIIKEVKAAKRQLPENVEVYPLIIFKKEFFAKNYDLALQFIEKHLNLAIILPDSRNFKTDFYGLVFDGYKTTLKLMGYNSSASPKRLRWKDEDLQKNTEDWMQDSVAKASLITFVMNLMLEDIPEEEKVRRAEDWLKDNLEQ